MRCIPGLFYHASLILLQFRASFEARRGMLHAACYMPPARPSSGARHASAWHMCTTTTCSRSLTCANWSNRERQPFMKLKSYTGVWNNRRMRSCMRVEEHDGKGRCIQRSQCHNASPVALGRKSSVLTVGFAVQLAMLQAGRRLPQKFPRLTWITFLHRWKSKVFYTGVRSAPARVS